MRNVVKPYALRVLTGLLRHLLIGLGGSALFMVIVFAFDIGYQRELFLTFSDGIQFLTYLFFQNGLAFAGISFIIWMIGRHRSGYSGYVGPSVGAKLQLFRPRNFFLCGLVLFILSIQHFINFVTFPWPDAPAHIRASNSFHSDVAMVIFFASVAVTAIGLVVLLVHLAKTLAPPKRHMDAQQPD